MKKVSNQTGFTIIELLIATVVFSAMLVLLSMSMISIGRQFYKGVIASRTQETARSIATQISRSIQFTPSSTLSDSAAPTSSDPGSFCAGTKGLNFFLGQQLAADTDSTRNQMKRVTAFNDGCPILSKASFEAGTVTGDELLGRGMRLSKLGVKSLGGDLFQVTVKVTFGDDDLLDDPTGANATCKPGAGSQFCATSEISVTVFKRR